MWEDLKIIKKPRIRIRIDTDKSPFRKIILITKIRIRRNIKKFPFKNFKLTQEKIIGIILVIIGLGFYNYSHQYIRFSFALIIIGFIIILLTTEDSLYKYKKDRNQEQDFY